MVLGIAAAVACYGAAFRSVRFPTRGTGLFFSGLAPVLILLATSGASSSSPYLWGILAILAYSLGRVTADVAFSFHGGLYLLAAGTTSGLVRFTAYALAAPAELAWPPLSIPSLFVLAAAIASCGIEIPLSFDRTRGARLPKLLALSVAVSGAGAVLMLLLRPLAGPPGGPTDAAILATLRTAILGLAAIGLGVLGGAGRRREAGFGG
jgi:hypothetical protein